MIASDHKLNKYNTYHDDSFTAWSTRFHLKQKWHITTRKRLKVYLLCYKLDPSITFCGVGVIVLAASYALQYTGSTYKQRQIQRTAGFWDKCSTEFNLSQDHLLAALKTYVLAFYEFGTSRTGLLFRGWRRQWS